MRGRITCTVSTEMGTAARGLISSRRELDVYWDRKISKFTDKHISVSHIVDCVMLFYTKIVVLMYCAFKLLVGQQENLGPDLQNIVRFIVQLS